MKLDIGCGLHQKEPREEWTHLDLNPGPHIEIVTDFGRIPLDTESVEHIHAGDVIEHIPQWRLKEVLPEWNRILVLGGTITGSMPNLDRVMRDYHRGELSLHDAILNLYGWGDRPTEQHFVTYTMDTLRAMMAEFGFGELEFSGSPGNPQCPWWLVFSGKKVSRVAWREYEPRVEPVPGSVEHQPPAEKKRRNLSQAGS